jgi:hypothetical protein
MRFGVTETLVNIAHIQKFCIGVNYRRRRNLAEIDIGSIGGGRCHILFRYQGRHRFVDPSGSDLVNDDAAIAKSKVLAIGTSTDKPAVES